MRFKALFLAMGSLLTLIGLVYAQGLISFPQNFEVTIPQLPARQSQNQIIFNCPYDQNIEYRAVGVRELTWNGTIPKVDVDVKYWTRDKQCAGSKRISADLPITLSQQALIINLQNQINLEFIEEAQSNHQRNESRGYIAGSLS